MTSKDQLYGAIVRDDTEAAREVVARDPSVLALRFLGATWLHLAARLGRLEIMKLLVASGLPVGELTEDGTQTPLETAAGQGHYRACEWLLDNGADINRGLGSSVTPIFCAIFGKSFDVVKMFVERGADLGATFGVPTRTVVSYAQLYGTPEVVAYLKSLVSA